MIGKLFSEMLGIAFQLPFERLSFHDAMERFGNDKPDMRFGMELKDCADIVRKGTFKDFHDARASGGRVKALNAKGLASLSRRELDMLTEEPKTFGAKGLAWIKMKDGFESPIAKFFGREVLEEMARTLEAQEGDLLLFVADRAKVVHDVLSRMRLSLAERLRVERSGFRFVWIMEFPLLEWDEEEQRFAAMHHPFTSPTDEGAGAVLSADVQLQDLGPAGR